MARTTLRRHAVLAALAAGATLACAPSALATFPGNNGAIAFSRGGDIWTINADGSGEKRLTSGPHADGAPEWSPDGRELLFQRTGDDGPHIYRMNADGSGVSWVRQGADPQLSGDGTRLAYLGEDTEASRPAAYVAKLDGSDPELLIANDALTSVDDWAPNHSFILMTGRDGDSGILGRSPAGIEAGYGVLHDDRHFNNYYPSFSPDGSKIAFATQASGISGCDDTADPTCGGDPDVGIRTMDIGAGDVRTINPLPGIEPTFSPNGRHIVFRHDDSLGIMDADGQNVRVLVKGSSPDWQPVPKAPPSPPPPPATQTVTVPVEVPGPERVVEKVVTRTVRGAPEKCVVPKGKRRFTLLLRAHKQIKGGMGFKVIVDLDKGKRGKATVTKGKRIGLKAGVR